MRWRREQIGGVGFGAQHLAADADDAVAADDAGALGAGARHHVGHHQLAGGVALQHHAVVGAWQVHVDQRQRGEREGGDAGERQQAAGGEQRRHRGGGAGSR